ncbi:MAG: flagellar basal body P-ring protein FlgI [Gammaproteobacteria bacterium]
MKSHTAKMSVTHHFLIFISLCIFTVLTLQVQADRIKDIASVAGVRSNQLVGYGLVVGLDGTGDQTAQAQFTLQSLQNMLTQFGITLPPGSNPQLKNIAAVAIHADLPAFAKPGQKIDVTVSSIANAKSLRGGSLLMTPLKGADGNVYGIAQGNLIVGGFGASGNDGSSITVNVPSVGRIPNGAIIERSVSSDFANDGFITLNLHSPDFTTAYRLSEGINDLLGGEVAESIDASSVRVRAPLSQSARIAFVSELENLTVDPGEAPARVIINSRTGTVVIGANVQVTPAAVSHGSLVVTISEAPFVSQPEEFARRGNTEVVENSEVSITQQDNRMFLFQPGVTLDEIVRAVNEVGAAPGDLVAILEALKQAGSLRAELVVI